MKKIAFFLLTIIVIGLITSCASSSRCAAYGERQRFQVERR